MITAEAETVASQAVPGHLRNTSPHSVHLRGACLAYAGQTLFDGLDLDLPAGQTTCLLGPSGVGKSSLLRLLAGLVDDQPVQAPRGGDGKPLQGRVAYMGQQDLLFPWLTVIENVMLGARLRGDSADPVAARRLLREVGLASSERALPHQLSGGMRQRAAVARTLMEDRPVVLMDEPFSSLDTLTRYRLQQLAAGLLGGRTVLLVTHDPMEALRMAHRVHVMAERPARLYPPLFPPGRPPRDSGEPSLVAFQRTLMRQLGLAADAQ